MKLLCLKEQTSCYYYSTDVKVGFRSFKVDSGTFKNDEIVEYNYLVFVLEGKLLVSCDEYVDQEVRAGEMFFIAKTSRCNGRILNDSRIIVLSYENVTDLCNKTSILSLGKECKGRPDSFVSLPICSPLNLFLELMVSYLDSKGNCICLHEIKLKELFWLLRAYYNKEDLAKLFYPIIGKSHGFRDKVMMNYRKAGTAKELARLCGYSRQQFTRLFTEEFAVSPFSWMQEQLMLQIKGRLADKDVPLKSIVDEFEFSSMPHFIRLCKNRFGETPAELRKKLINE